MKHRSCLAIATLIAMLHQPISVGQVRADEIRDRQWHLDYLHVGDAHRISLGRGVVVAVIDTGVASHRDLEASVLAGMVTIPGQSGDGRTDAQGHGTAMAGLIAAHGHGDDAGALGVAPGARILPIRISLTPSMTGDQSGLAPAIDFAVASRAQILNISVGASPSDTLRQAVERALAADAVVVASAGNTDSSLDGVVAPAAYPGVIAVAAIDQAGRRAKISVSGPQVVLAAPGVDIVSTGLNDGYNVGSGTSGATAIVSGAAALVRSRYPNLSAAEVVHRLTATATDAGAPGRDEEYGYGVLNLVDALTKDVPPLQPSVSASPGPTVTGASPGPSNGSKDIPRWALVAVVLLALLGAGGMWTALRRRTPE